jgi:hypothetical protein
LGSGQSALPKRPVFDPAQRVQAGEAFEVVVRANNAIDNLLDVN